MRRTIQIVHQKIEAEELHWLLFVLLVDGKAIGACELNSWKTSCPLLCNLSIAHKFRSKGHGTALVHRVISECRRHRKQSVHLTVSKKNPAAMKLYRRLGFFTCIEDANYFWMTKKVRR